VLQSAKKTQLMLERADLTAYTEGQRSTSKRKFPE